MATTMLAKMKGTTTITTAVKEVARMLIMAITVKVIELVILE